MTLLRSAALAAVLLAGATAAQADEVRLDAQQLDAVSAGFFSMPDVGLGGLGGIGGHLGGVQLPSLGDRMGDIGWAIWSVKSRLGGVVGYLPIELPNGMVN